MRRQRTPGQQKHFERTHDALQVARLHAASRVGVAPRQHAVQELGASTRGDRLETGAQGDVATGAGKQSSRQGAVIEPRPTDDQWQRAARLNLANHPSRIASVMRRRVFVGRIDDVDEVMRDPLPLHHRHLVGADVEAPVHGGRIAVDDLAAEPVSQRNRQGALANGGRTENGYDERR